MVRYLRYSLCALAFFSSANQVLANDQRSPPTGQSVDAANLDVAGIRKGMSGKEVIEQLTKKYGPASTGNAAFGKNSNPNWLSTKYSTTYGDVKVEKYLSELSFSGPDLKLDVYFLPNPSFDGTETVRKVWYKFNVPDTPENLKAFQSVLIEKYGPPSIIDVFVASWCTVKPLPYTTLKTCQDHNESLNYMMTGKSLEIKWMPFYGNELEEAVRRKREVKKPQL